MATRTALTASPLTTGWNLEPSSSRQLIFLVPPFPPAQLLSMSSDPLLFQLSAVQLKVLVDVAQTGSVTITKQKLSGSLPEADLLGTLTLTSSLYEGATRVETVLPPSRVQLEAVLDDSFELEGGDQIAQATALPSDKAASEPPPVLAQAVRPAQTSEATLDSTTGTLTIPLSPINFFSTEQTQAFQVVSGACKCSILTCSCKRVPCPVPTH